MSIWTFWICLAAAGAAAIGGAVAEEWDVRSDTWTAADALGRRLPGYEECGPPRSGRYVGIFYFIWLGSHGTGGPYDITKILAANPDDPQWGPPHAFHHWGEPEIGYYLSDEEWVLRRHARMLSDAGIDTVILDVTNGVTYDPVFLKLCEVWEKMRKNGERTPQMCFIANSGSDAVVQRLYDGFYSKGLHSDLWFRWQGRPLMLASPAGLDRALTDFFTFRQSWAWSDPGGWFGDGREKWPWLDTHPQAYGWRVEGVPEEMAVCVAQHPTTNIGRSFHGGKQPDPEEFRTDEGLCFAEQWRRALEVDPEFVFVTGWNEWVAMRFLSDGNAHMLGRRLPEGETFFVDQFNREYSRDIEPMKDGHTDNYYYQLIANVRRFKGVRKPESAGPPKTIKIDGDFSDWDDVKPEYLDHIGDTEHRNSKGWGSAGVYTNTTGRNDFVRLKVARDAEHLYFYAETKDDITPFSDPNWMMLFVDADCDPSTGWHGYDFLVNYPPADSRTTTVKKNAGGWKWEAVCDAPMRVAGRRMEIAIPRSAISASDRDGIRFDFHWADNVQRPGDIMEFAVSGDSAPDRRANYRYDARDE